MWKNLLVVASLAQAIQGQIIAVPNPQETINIVVLQWDAKDPCYYKDATDLASRSVPINADGTNPAWRTDQTAEWNVNVLFKASCKSRGMCFDWKAPQWCWRPAGCSSTKQCPDTPPPVAPAPAKNATQPAGNSTKTPTTTGLPPVPWKCIQSCGDGGAFVQVADYGRGIQCHGMNDTTCTWFDDAKCTQLRPQAVPPTVDRAGRLCADTDFAGGWCLEARNQIVNGKPQTDCTAPPPAPPPPPPPSHAGLLEAPGKPLWGIHNDWGSETPLMWLNNHDGVVPAMFTGFLSIGSSFQEYNMRTHVELVAMAARYGTTPGYMIATMPWEGLWAISDAAIQQLVGACRDAENRGVHIIVRFGHEMNANWYPYGMQPQAYVQAFRRVALAVKQGSPKTEMMWAPQWFDAWGQSPDFDPYSAYYPGDDVVDWVALTFYHFGNTWPPTNDYAPFDKFENGLTGYGNRWYHANFYYRYAVERNKRFAIAETGAPWIDYQPDLGTNAQVRMSSWWRQVINPDIIARYPLYQAAFWFDYNKYEENQHRDFRLRKDDWIWKTFRDDIANNPIQLIARGW